MTSVHAFCRSGIYAALIASSIGLAGISLATGELRAQSATESDLTATDNDQDAEAPVDRGKMRLKLLINLVENELEEASLSQSRLTIEAASLDQQRQALLAGPSKGTLAEERQIAVIGERLQQIDQEMVGVNSRLPEIRSELAELQARLDESNGVVREPATDTASIGAVVNGASQWLDGNRQVQEALVYLGGYNALIDGDFGPRTAEAVRVYQAARSVATTGTLTSEQQEALLSEAETLRARYGMRAIEDKEAGYRVSYPSGLLPEESAVGARERRFKTLDGQGELLITSSSDDGGTSTFSNIYDQLIADYEVQYRRKRGDWFVVAGLVEEERIIYDTARLNGDRIIRARLSYPAEWRDLWSPFAVIMFNTFEAVTAGES